MAKRRIRSGFNQKTHRPGSKNFGKITRASFDELPLPKQESVKNRLRFTARTSLSLGDLGRAQDHSKN